ncbi:T9SS type A sorting domain-containing protein [Winogradskyella litorisediminis]|uniref:T9SS type A sorting domain-containing protein n=1 Tax=Winogradskyella litorisediminis TaxID=1156618 RepID=A0ABW3N968_9FLAO
MKKISLLLFIFCGFGLNLEAQSSDLYQTWYLNFCQSSDGSPEYTVSNINPPITPTLTISNDGSFTGVAACNTFSGVFEFLPNGTMSIQSYSTTTNDCGNANLNNFEASYRDTLDLAAFYNVGTDANGMTLALDTPIFGGADFTNYVLSTNAFLERKISVYPNPVKDIIHIKSNTALNKIEIYSLNGKMIHTENKAFDNLNLEFLNSGIYLVKFYTENGSTFKKIVKE